LGGDVLAESMDLRKSGKKGEKLFSFPFGASPYTVIIKISEFHE
jgi:hypothetical protein